MLRHTAGRTPGPKDLLRAAAAQSRHWASPRILPQNAMIRSGCAGFPPPLQPCAPATTGRPAVRGNKWIYLVHAAAGSNGLLGAAEGGCTAKAWSRRAREVSREREIRVEDGGEATGRSLIWLGAHPRSSSGTSCRTKGARPAPLARASSRREQRCHRAEPSARCVKRWTGRR